MTTLSVDHLYDFPSVSLSAPHQLHNLQRSARGTAAARAGTRRLHHSIWQRSDFVFIWPRRHVGTDVGTDGSSRKPQKNILEERKQHQAPWKVRWKSKIVYSVDNDVLSCSGECVF